MISTICVLGKFPTYSQLTDALRSPYVLSLSVNTDIVVTYSYQFLPMAHYLPVVFVAIAVLAHSVESCTSRARRNNPTKTYKRPQANYDFQCRDESGRPLSWYIAYKLAKIPGSSIRLIKNGRGYAYLIPESTQWQVSDRSIGLQDSVVGRTLRPLYTYQNSEELLYLLYNDQPPHRSTASYNGHSKGVIIAGANGGIWLQHSVPKFPDITKDFEYPSSGENNAQLLFCVSLSSQNIEAVIGQTLLHVKPIIYNHSVPIHLKEVYPSLAKLVAPGRRKNTDPSKVFSLIERDLNVTVFAKSPKFEKDIYAEWLAPALDSSLKVQSWLNGVNSLDSNCNSTRYQILNIVDKQVRSHRFTTQKDHSKWAISERGDWTCISDLNRMESQKSRGGAAVCIKDQRVWNSFENAVLDVQPCGLKGRRNRTRS